jgi:hypothetical protein
MLVKACEPPDDTAIRRFHASNVTLLTVDGLLGCGISTMLPAASQADCAQPRLRIAALDARLPKDATCFATRRWESSWIAEFSGIEWISGHFSAMDSAIWTLS